MTSGYTIGLSGQLEELIREYPDFPVQGVRFLDLALLHADPPIRSAIGTEIANRFAGDFDTVLAIDARGIPMDDVLATGEPAAAAVELVRKSNATPIGVAIIAELVGLGGRTRLDPSVRLEAVP
jgi:adenine phosphoribosyltransferase